MNEWENKYRQSNKIREEYPTGTRIVLLHMTEDPMPIPDNSRGTVQYVDDAAQIHVKWDNGRGLAVVPGVDQFRKLTEKEISEEGTKNQ